jgi:hypothetical protein
MNTPDPAKEQSALSAAEAVPVPQTGEVTAAIRALLMQSPIEDPNDRALAEEALAFLDSSDQGTSKGEVIASRVGELAAYGDPSFEELNRCFQQFLCERYISDATAKLAHVPSDLPVIRHAVQLALDFSSTFAKGYGNGSFLEQARALRVKVEQLEFLHSSGSE